MKTFDEWLLDPKRQQDFDEWTALPEQQETLRKHAHAIADDIDKEIFASWRLIATPISQPFGYAELGEKLKAVLPSSGSNQEEIDEAVRKMTEICREHISKACESTLFDVEVIKDGK